MHLILSFYLHCWFVTFPLTIIHFIYTLLTDLNPLEVITYNYFIISYSLMKLVIRNIKEQNYLVSLTLLNLVIILLPTNFVGICYILYHKNGN